MALTLEQLKQRRHGLGGSDAAAILGISKWKTPLDIFFDKVEEDRVEQELTPVIEWGNRLEPVLVQKFQELTGKKVELREGIVKHPKYDFMLANIDGFIPEENAILECKTTDRFMSKEWEEEGSDKLPDYYLTQCAHYAEVLGVDKVYVAVLIGGNNFKVYEYNRTQKLHDVIIAAEKHFWESHVLTKIPPEPSSVSDCQKLWRDAIEGQAIAANEDVAATITDMRRLNSLIKNFQLDYKKKSMEIYSFMKEAELLNNLNGEIVATWKNQTTNRFDMELFKQEHPELISKYIKQSSFRVLRFKGNSDDQ